MQRETDQMKNLARVIAYSAASPYLEKGVTMQQFWPLKSDPTAAQLDDDFEKRAMELINRRTAEYEKYNQDVQSS